MGEMLRISPLIGNVSIFQGANKSDIQRAVAHRNSKDDAHLLSQKLRFILLPLSLWLDRNVRFTASGSLAALHPRFSV